MTLAAIAAFIAKYFGGVLVGAAFEFLRGLVADSRNARGQRDAGRLGAENAALVERDRRRRKADAVFEDLQRDADRQP